MTAPLYKPFRIEPRPRWRRRLRKAALFSVGLIVALPVSVLVFLGALAMASGVGW